MNDNCRIESFMNSSSKTSVIFRYLDLLAESSVRIQAHCDELEIRLASAVDELAQGKRRSNEPNIFLTSVKNDLEWSRQRCAELDRRLVGTRNELSKSQKRCDDLNRRLVAAQNELMQSRSKALPQQSPKNDDSVRRVFLDVSNKSRRVCVHCGSTNLMFSNSDGKSKYCYDCKRYL